MFVIARQPTTHRATMARMTSRILAPLAALVIIAGGGAALAVSGTDEPTGCEEVTRIIAQQTRTDTGSDDTLTRTVTTVREECDGGARRTTRDATEWKGLYDPPGEPTGTATPDPS